MKNKKVAHIYRNNIGNITGNKIILVKKDGSEEEISEIQNTKIKYYGENSLIKIGENFNINKLTLYIGENCYIKIGHHFTVRFNVNIDVKVNDTTLVIGNFANLSNGTIFAGDEEQLEVIIGNNFLTALNFNLRNSDGHTIYNLSDKSILNKPEFGIHIGDNVWIGYNVSIMKDVSLPDNVVVGACSVVSKHLFEKNSIIAGVPARTIKTNIGWDSRPITRYLKEITKQTT